MFVKVTKARSGKHYINLVESYRENGIVKHRIIEKLGFLEDYESTYKDPLTHFKQLAKERNEEKSSDNANLKRIVEINPNEKLEPGKSDLKNIGYGIIKRDYKLLNLSHFWAKYTSDRNFKYNIDKIFQFLVYGRIINPDSKKATYEKKDMFFEPFGDFSLDDIYNALEVIGNKREELQKWIFDNSSSLIKRDVGICYFDCTNYYWDVTKPDIDIKDDDGNVVKKGYRKYGPEKNHRKDPIVELGLLMDATGLPLGYELFPGNESEKKHMLPIINRVSQQYNLNRIIVVADRGLNTSTNIFYLNGDNKSDNNPRDGYIYGQSVRGAGEEFKKWVLDQKGYINTKIEKENNDEDTGNVIRNADNMRDDTCEGYFRHKSRIAKRKITIEREHNDGTVGTTSVFIDQKQLVYYSAKYAKKQKLERDRAVERANDLIAHPKKYDKMSAKGASGYVMNISFNKDTGEVIAHNLQLDKKKIEEEEKYDGYYSIVTSELKMDDLEIRKHYRGLIKIEDTFKISKSDLEARPAYVWTQESIEGHFAICYTALFLLRFLQKRLNKKYSSSKIIDSLRQCNADYIVGNEYKLVYVDEIIEECARLNDIDLSKRFKTRNELRRILKY